MFYQLRYCWWFNLFKHIIHVTYLWWNRCQLIIFYPREQVCLQFYNIHQCQLTIIWVNMVTCGAIVFPKVLWIQHLQIIIDFNDLNINLQINANSNKMIQNCLVFSQVMFFHIYYQRENMNRKGILLVKLSEATAMQCENTRRPQHGMSKSPSMVLCKCGGIKTTTCVIDYRIAK